MFTFITVAPPEPNIKYYDSIVQLNQPVILNCSVSAVPHPEFQWILEDSGDHLPDSSWNSTYVDKRTTSTLNYTFGTAHWCRIQVLCIATNSYGRSEHHFTLSLNSSENNCSWPVISDCRLGISDSHNEVIISSTVGVATVLLVAILIVVSAVLTLQIYKRR